VVVAKRSSRTARLGGVVAGLILIVVATACAADLNASDAGVASEANDINNAGWIVGSRGAPGHTEAFVRSPEGVVTALPGLTGATTVVAKAINNSGTVVGWDGGSSGGPERAIRWDAAGTPTELPGVGGPTRAVDINDAGDIVGGSTTPGAPPHLGLEPVEPVFWRHTGSSATPTPTPLPELNTNQFTITFITGINNGGLIVGYSDTNAEDDHALKWVPNASSPSGYTLVEISPPGGIPDFEALAVNDNGDIVGVKDHVGVQEIPPTGSFQPGQAILFPADGSPIKVLDGIAGVRNNSVANAIGNDGTIVGQAVAADGTTHAVRWTPDTRETTDLGSLGGNWSSPRAVNDSVAIVGASRNADTPQVIRATKF
jgi:probable HAF family extracellular repeat protein